MLGNALANLQNPRIDGEVNVILKRLLFSGCPKDRSLRLGRDLETVHSFIYPQTAASGWSIPQHEVVVTGQWGCKSKCHHSSKIKILFNLLTCFRLRHRLKLNQLNRQPPMDAELWCWVVGDGRRDGKNSRNYVMKHLTLEETYITHIEATRLSFSKLWFTCCRRRPTNREEMSNTNKVSYLWPRAPRDPAPERDWSP